MFYPKTKGVGHMNIKTISKEIRQDLYNVELSEEEVDALYRYINLGDYGIELTEGINILEKDTLWLIVAELNNKKDFPNILYINILAHLKKLLYPIE